jgi:glycosyltransferase involved in cell wall biosynthesis
MDKAFRPTLPMLFTHPGGSPQPGRTGDAESVSVLMRTKSRPLLLPRAMRSVLSQTFRDWHLFVVNDGGEPDAVERLVAGQGEAFAGRITVLHHGQSLGMEAASNTALDAARGEYVVVHDDDDSWDPAFLQNTVGFLSAPANAVYIGVVTKCSVVWERVTGEQVVEEAQAPFPMTGQNIELRRVLATNSFPPISLLMRREAVLRVGAFNADMPVLGDWEFNLRALVLGDFGFIPEPLAYYHKRLDAADLVYGNSVVTGTADHQRYDVLLRNNIIRLALHDNPAMFGVLQPMLHALGEHTEAMKALCESVNELRIRLDRVEEHLSVIHEVSRWQGRLLSPIQRAWMGLMPLRRVLGRLFGRERS